MNSDNGTIGNLAFIPVKLFCLETVLLSEVVDPGENLYKEYLSVLDTKHLFPETLPDDLQNTTDEDFSFLHLNIRSLQKYFDDFKSFLSHLNFTYKVICLTETRLLGA